VTATADILQEVAAERCSQDAKWGDQRMHPTSHWHLILSEEVGEAADAILEHASLRSELIQVAAVAVAAIESHDWQLKAPTERGLWGDQITGLPGSWHLLLSKELGDVAKATLERNVARLRRELIELAATTSAAIEYLDTQG